LTARAAVRQPWSKEMNGSKASAVEINLDYLNKIKARGRVYWYYRRTGQNIAIGLAPDEPGFGARYDEIHARFEAAPAGRLPAPEGTLAALIDGYKAKSPEYRKLKPTSKRAYDAYLTLLRDDHGKHQVRTMPRAFVFGLRDKYQETPRKANYIIQVLRAVLTFGVDRGWRADNPASKPKLLKPVGDGHRPFEESEIASFRECWPVGSLERACFELLINTGQRMSDIVAMARPHIAKGEIAVAQEKTGARVWIPLSNDLNAALAPYLATHGHVVLLVTRKAKKPTSWTISGLQHLMRDAYRDAGLPDDVTNHGGRYTAATILHELGCDWETIGAITGHETMAMVKKYTAKRRKARIAIGRLNRARASPKAGS
jgi:integrase